jgi:hypothetical protein
VLLLLSLLKPGRDFASSSFVIKERWVFFFFFFFSHQTPLCLLHWRVFLGCVFLFVLGVSDFYLFSRCECVCVFWGSFGSGIILLLGVLEFSGFCSCNTRLCFFHCVHNVLVWFLGGFEER